MKVMIQTKSNYRNLNGKWLTVHECQNKRVSCIVEDPEAKDGKLIADFDIKEVVMMSYSANKESKTRLDPGDSIQPQIINEMQEQFTYRVIDQNGILTKHSVQASNGKEALEKAQNMLISIWLPGFIVKKFRNGNH